MPHFENAPIFLIGYRGTGKSTVGRLLAERLGYDSIDTDDEVELRTGKSIAAIFANAGENAFRKLEAEVIAELCGRTQIVVATGGGAVLRKTTRSVMRAAGPIVWLTASIDTIAARLATDDASSCRRPKLTAAGGKDEIETLLQLRKPIYRACATFVVDTEGKSPVVLANEILVKLLSHDRPK